MDKELTQAIRLRKNGQSKASLRALLRLSKEKPRDPKINYQCAWAHDILGREREAVPYYSRAIKNGLSGRDLEGALLGLGSSLRCLGRYRQAEKILRFATKKFQKNRALQVFIAMVLINNG